MKSKWMFCVMLVLAAAMNANATVLFSDSYGRADNTDIDADSAGMSGDLAPMVYQEAFEGSGQPASIQILNEQLNIAVGAGMSSLYLDHNFTDAGILTDGGFSVSMDVVKINVLDDEGNRFAGFGVGNTLVEVQEAKDSFDMDAPLRPALHRQGLGVSDFYVDLALDQKLRLWNNGTVLQTIDVGAVSGTIKVDFLVSDFNAGSSVTALVYFDGAYQTSQAFTWDNADSNYLGISGRSSAVFLDNLEIATVPEPATMVLLGLGAFVLRKRK